jgi:hypothetical protein
VGELPCPEALRAHLLDPAVVASETADDLLAGRLDFLTSPRTYGAHVDWRPRGPNAPSHLWRMHLHYHRFALEAVVGALRRPDRAPALLERAGTWLLEWSAACPPGEGTTFEDAWSPYSAAVRLLHGVSARRLLQGIAGQAAERLRRILDGRGAADADFLARWLEHDLGGNHPPAQRGGPGGGRALVLRPARTGLGHGGRSACRPRARAPDPSRRLPTRSAARCTTPSSSKTY